MFLVSHGAQRSAGNILGCYSCPNSRESIALQVSGPEAPPPKPNGFCQLTLQRCVSVSALHCCCSVAKLCPTLWDPMNCSTAASLSFTVSQSLLRLMSIDLVMPFSHLILCCPLLLLLSIFPASGALPMSQLFAWDGQSLRASASASVLPISIQGWFPLESTGLNSLLSNLKSLLRHHNSKASILRHSAFFMVQLSHAYMATRKTIALTRWTLVSKVMSLLLNMSKVCHSFSS